MKVLQATVAQLATFDEVIDVRSPAEFALDHIPGAINAPVLSDAERAEVGTLYKQHSPFAARVHGAALVARNIAHHLEERFASRPKNWKPLVYCWRGGQRSGALALIFAQIGWQVGRLQGGYKSFRRAVFEDLERLPLPLDFVVLCGETGSAKSRLLRELARAGEQVLDLEAIACHRGSVLGQEPDRPQPSQKGFETQLWQALRTVDPARPVYAEAESRKIGRLRMPEALMNALRDARCVRIEASLEWRTDHLLREYGHFMRDPALLREQLQHLKTLHSKEALKRWDDFIEAGDWPSLVSELLAAHYDPAYRKSTAYNFMRLSEALRVPLEGESAATLSRAAESILAAARREQAAA